MLPPICRGSTVHFGAICAGRASQGAAGRVRPGSDPPKRTLRRFARSFARDGKHEIIRVGRTSGNHQVDITRGDSVALMFEQVGHVDAIVVAAGNVILAPIEKMAVADFHKGLQDKLLGQVRVALVGQAVSPTMLIESAERFGPFFPNDRSGPCVADR